MNLIIYTLRAVAGAIVTSPLIFILIMLAVLLYLKNNKTVLMQRIILGGSVNSSIELTLSQMVLGIIGGAIGSLILTALGIIFYNNSGIVYLFLFSMIFAFIKPRLICFSYSGAVLGIIGIIISIVDKLNPNFQYRTILNVNILYLMMFIGVLHIIEGILVIADGDRGAVPVFTNKNGKIFGGYALRRYWILPVAIMLAVTMNDSSIYSYFGRTVIETPNWWPLIKTPSISNILSTAIISISTFYALIGYSSVTFTRSKRKKAVVSGVYILAYGILLILVAQVSRLGIVGEIITVVFAPIGHELMLIIQRKDENKRKPKFSSDEDGLTILEIAIDSEMKKSGVKVGDKLISINNKIINSESEIYPIIKESLYNVILKIRDSNGIERDLEFKHDKNRRLGILLVPKSVKNEDVVPLKDNFQDVLDKIKK